MNIKKQSKKSKHYVYILECCDKTLYTGYAKDLDKRVEKHNTGKGAKYTRGRSPVKLVWFKRYNTLSEALKEECRIKKLRKDEKLFLIEVYRNSLKKRRKKRKKQGIK